MKKEFKDLNFDAFKAAENKIPVPRIFSDFLEKNMPFYFVLSPICAIFAVSINIRR